MFGGFDVYKEKFRTFSGKEIAIENVCF